MTSKISTYQRLLEAEARQRRHPYWGPLHRQLDQIEASKPQHAHEVIALLGGAKGSARFPGGSDRELLGSLHEAGWETSEYHAAYFWTAAHPATGDSLEYIEGDVYDRTQG